MKIIIPSGLVSLLPYFQMRSTDMNETEAIFRIVLRNLTLSNWSDLLPEAQQQMFEEVSKLISLNALTLGKKQQLRMSLDALCSRVSEVHRNRISQLLALSASYTIYPMTVDKKYTSVEKNNDAFAKTNALHNLKV